MDFIYRIEQNHKVAAPVTYQIAASFFMALTSLFVKFLNDIPATQILVIRSIIGIVLIFYFVDKYSIDCYPKSKNILKKLILRGILGSVGATLWFTSLKLINLSEAIVLHKTAPLWTTIIAVFIIRSEKFSYKAIIEIFVCLLGIVLITRPPFIKKLFGEEFVEVANEYHTLGACLSLSTAIIVSIVQVLISSLSGQVNQLAILQYFSIMTICNPIIYQMYSPFEQWQSPKLHEWIYLIAGGLTGCIAQVLMNRSFILGDLTQISLVGQSQILMNLLFDIVILHSNVSLLSIIGITLVISSLVSAILKKKKK